MSDLLTPKEFADLKRVHVDTVLRWVRLGRIPDAEKSGGVVRIPASARVRSFGAKR